MVLCPAVHTLDHPVGALDPDAADLHTEGELLRRYGPIIPVTVSGVPVWMTTGHAASKAVLDHHPDLAKGLAHWRALQEGRVPQGWPLLPILAGANMLNANGADHRRLRTLIAQAFTPRRIREFTPRIEEITEGLLHRLAAGTADGPADLKAEFAYPMPMAVICEFFGVPDPRDRNALHTHFETLLSSTPTPEELQAAHLGIQSELRRLVDGKRRVPGDDLTTALIAAHAEDGDRLSEQELIDTLLLFLLGGHDTTVNLITNTVRALLSHPDQLDRLQRGVHDWADAVEAGLQWSGPVRGIYLRFATRDTHIAGTLVRSGEPVMVALASANRDADVIPQAERFDITRNNRSHIAFGAGAHFCIGAPLARVEAAIALRALFTRFPRLTAAVADRDLVPLTSYGMNGLQALPVHLEPQALAA
ncbi:cytochrome P450 family protein [Streptomyces meridianus]|uniref:Cytochrome P450 n=1 Tax=Streptomyces meridianus TaxID=2938945 RepID=A0ABT0XAF5_9ACTN|nr:cytochrome P450 [Streptomyces meridianus]MCM2579504.1 cytochrome P450 [Streptomyces meridianus]